MGSIYSNLFPLYISLHTNSQDLGQGVVFTCPCNSSTMDPRLPLSRGMLRCPLKLKQLKCRLRLHQLTIIPSIHLPAPKIPSLLPSLAVFPPHCPSVNNRKCPSQPLYPTHRQSQFVLGSQFYRATSKQNNNRPCSRSWQQSVLVAMSLCFVVTRKRTCRRHRRSQVA